MIRRCGRCAAPLLPADGPSLLWSGHEARPVRVAVHLRCWLSWQRTGPDTTGNAAGERPSPDPEVAEAHAVA
jgi:hypothetical protein